MAAECGSLKERVTDRLRDWDRLAVADRTYVLVVARSYTHFGGLGCRREGASRSGEAPPCESHLTGFCRQSRARRFSLQTVSKRLKIRFLSTRASNAKHGPGLTLTSGPTCLSLLRWSSR